MEEGKEETRVRQAGGSAIKVYMASSDQLQAFELLCCASELIYDLSRTNHDEELYDKQTEHPYPPQGPTMSASCPYIRCGRISPNYSAAAAPFGGFLISLANSSASSSSFCLSSVLFGLLLWFLVASRPGVKRAYRTC